jgi:hypothetical protein
MGKLNFDIDEASLLKTYGLSNLAPAYVISTVWRHVVAQRRVAVNGKISIMTWTSHMESH